MQNLDEVIVVGTNQVNYYEGMMDKGKVYFVPHGIDTDFLVLQVQVAKLDKLKHAFLLDSG